jgi:hypothetical protein
MIPHAMGSRAGRRALALGLRLQRASTVQQTQASSVKGAATPFETAKPSAPLDRCKASCNKPAPLPTSQHR